MIGARLPTRRASIASGEPALIRAFPGVTFRPTRSGYSVSDAASTAWRAAPRDANSTSPSASAAAAASNPARRSDWLDTIVSRSTAADRRAASAIIIGASAGASVACETWTAVTSRSPSDGARSSMKRAT